MNKINFKQKKYILPLIVLPFIIFIIYSLSSMSVSEDIVVEEKNDEIKLNLGEDITKGEIKPKDDAYRDFYNTRGKDTRSEVQNIVVDEEAKKELNSNYSEEQQRKIDSLDEIRVAQKKILDEIKNKQESEKVKNQKESDLINIVAKEKLRNTKRKDKDLKDDFKELENIQMETMKKQIAFMDSLEAIKNPEIKRKKIREKEIQKKKKKYEDEKNQKLAVRTESQNNEFNSVFKEEKNQFIKAVIDEEMKGYLGSRIRIRLLESIFIGDVKIEKGTFLYSEISGFQLQRVELKIVSVMHGNNIYPIELDVYDNDGIKGLYVPTSIFREISNEAGSRSVQGQRLDATNQDFYTATATQFFQSSSRALSKLIRKNKAKIKFNTSIYLIDSSKQ